MKKVKILFSILIICLIGMYYNVKAEADEKITDTSKLIADCVYKGKYGKIDQTWHIYVHKEGSKLTAYSDDVDYSPFGAVYTTWKSRVNIKYAEYIGKDKKFSCENVSAIYFYKKGYSSDKNCKNEGGCYAFTFEKDQPKGYYKLDLDKTSSKVYAENNDKEMVDNGDWDLVCHYGPYYLNYKYDSGDYETNTIYNVDSEKYSSLAQSYKNKIKQLISENYNSCPTSYCDYEVDSGYVTQNFRFLSNKYEKHEGCYVSQQFAKEYSCGILSTSMEDYNKYSESQNKIELKKTETRIKDFCSNVYANLDYNDSTNCVKECLKAVDIIKTTNGSNVGECGFSARLMSFISNILRWIKYILPIIVIVLGILDFIKAIGADKDDEIKKAQGKFIKRLIAAALVFIVPLILEFVLDKMGFGYDDCGLF